MYRLVNRGDLAEDITQDCFLALLKHPGRWDPLRGDMKTYLFSIARNLAYKHYRDDPVKDDIAEDTPIPDPRVDQELPVLVGQMVSRLPDLQREALVLFEYEGFRLDEIARIVDADTGTVKARLHRARESMKRLLAPYRRVGATAHETV